MNFVCAENIFGEFSNGKLHFSVEIIAIGKFPTDSSTDNCL